jgi:hypothetical protein
MYQERKAFAKAKLRSFWARARSSNNERGPLIVTSE